MTVTSIAAGEVLKWDGAKWINNTLAEAGIQPAGSYADSGHTHTFASLTSRPTTLSGYGITDAATSSHNHDTSYLKLTGGTISGTLTIGTGTTSTLTNQTNGALRHSNTHGYIELGPQNTSHAHIYTDRATFYFNKELLVNGNTVYNSGNLNPSRIVKSATQPTTGLVDGLIWFNTTDNMTKVYFNSAFRDMGGSGMVSQTYRNTHNLTSATGVATIGIAGFNHLTDTLLVSQNSTLLSEGEDYTITGNGTTVTKAGGTWAAGTAIHFIAITFKAGPAAGGATNYVPMCYRKMITATANQSAITFSISQYTKETDTMIIHHNGTQLYEGVHYSMAANGASINLLGYTADAGDEFQFTVFKDLKTVLL